MKWSDTFIDYAEKHWQRRKAALPEFAGYAAPVLADCTLDEALLLKYFLATLPVCDLGDYPPKLLLKFAQNALHAREEFAWCAALPENIFLLYVAYPRINTEELADCRDIFHNALADRVRSLPFETAVLEVNRWCAEEATYRSTDLCTASPLAVYTCGWGRCGEESTFAVTALRSVGIAARQVYAPWWSHCDDNHAWVEVFDGTRWRYLGACEPEPELDRGWFTSAASRAMMVHARAFVQGDKEELDFLFPNAAHADIHVEHGVVLEAVTHNYAQTRLLTVQVKDGQDMPVSGARVSFSVLNMAQFAEIAARDTDKNGCAQINLGVGSVKASVCNNGLYAEAVINVAEVDTVTLILREAAETAAELRFAPPAGAPGYPQPLTADQKNTRRYWLAVAAASRERKTGAVIRPLTENEQQIWNSLTDKDRAGGLREQVISDSIPAFAYKDSCNADVFVPYLLCPRIHLEPLFPWRLAVTSAFAQQEREQLANDPRKIWAWIHENIALVDSYPELSGTPAGILRIRSANAMGKRVLFCALCRAFGVPARLSPLTGEPEFYADGVFLPVEKAPAGAELTLIAPADHAAQFAKNYTLSRMENGGFTTVDTGDIAAGGSVALTPNAGVYRLITVTRLPNGSQLADSTDIILTDVPKSVSLSFCEASAGEMLESQALPPFTLTDEQGSGCQSTEIFVGAKASLLLWLEVGREPTEHILNELRESASAFKASGCALHFILETAEQKNDPTLQTTLAALGEDCRIWCADFEDTVPTLARRMFGDPDKLPLIILADSKANGLYSCSGYNVGTAELILSLLAVIE